MLKEELALKYENDPQAYTMAKNDFIKNILFNAGYQGLTFTVANLDTEWQAYHHIRKTVLFDSKGIIYNPQHPTLMAQDHFHFVLMKGIAIIGAAQIQLLDKKRAALRPFAIDFPYQRQGYGTYFMGQIERWISHQGRRVIHLHSNPMAVKFYKRLGYREVPFPEDKPLLATSIDLGKNLD